MTINLYLLPATLTVVLFLPLKDKKLFTAVYSWRLVRPKPSFNLSKHKTRDIFCNDNYKSTSVLVVNDIKQKIDLL